MNTISVSFFSCVIFTMPLIQGILAAVRFLFCAAVQLLCKPLPTILFLVVLSHSVSCIFLNVNAAFGCNLQAILYSGNMIVHIQHSCHSTCSAGNGSCTTRNGFCIDERGFCISQRKTMFFKVFFFAPELTCLLP